MTKRFLNYLKKHRIPIPIGMGLLLAEIPYSIRPGIGELYSQQQKIIGLYSHFSQQEQELFIYQQFMKVFSHAFLHVKFYNDLYSKYGISPEDIRTFDDIQKVPIVTKEDLINYPINERSYDVKNRLIVNTGGSSGKSFSFYMDPSRYGNEWAHIHDMWSIHGYKPAHLKLSFDGRAKKNNQIVYDFARNSLLYDIYGSPLELGKQLIKILQKHEVKYLHGYPSAIYNFALYCESNMELLSLLKKQLKAAFLSSEYPSPHYRQKIEEVFDIPTQSFYGHTETCIMAVESSKYIYDAYQTYGFAEAIKTNEKFHLVGTSFFNFASPLIRYDTLDIIEPLNKDSKILSKFKIKDGRLGEFILDENNTKISLTGLIYGRHHELFNVCEHIQVFQEESGKAVILYVTKQEISEFCNR